MDDPSIVVREAKREDLPAAAKLAASLVRLHHEWDPLRFMRIEPIEEGYLRFFRSQLGRDDLVLLVAEADGGAIVGYLMGSLVDRDWSDLREACGKIHDLFVTEEARHHGVATRLVEEAVARFAALGAPRVVLMTAWKNDAGIRLFERLGFRRTMLEMTRESD